MSKARVDKGMFRLEYEQSEQYPFMLRETSGCNGDTKTYRALVAMRSVQDLRDLAKLCTRIADFADHDAGKAGGKDG